MKYRKKEAQQDEMVSGKAPKLRLVGDDSEVFGGVPPSGPEPLVQPATPPQDAVGLSEDRAFITSDGGTVAEADFDPDGDEAPRREIVAPWLRSKAGVVEVARDWAGRLYQAVAFHTVRVPMYLARLSGMAPYGVARVGGWWFRWVMDEGFVENRAAVRAGVSHGDVQKLTEAHNQQLVARWAVSVLLVLVGFLALWWAYTALPLWQFILAGLLASFGLGAAGYSRTEKQIIERTVYKGHHAPKFTESLLLQALRSAGAEPNGARPIQVIQPPVKVRSGWEAIVSLPVPAEDMVKKKHRAISTTLDRPQNCVWLTVNPEESAGFLRVVVTRKSLRRTVVPDWPLLKGGTFNYHTDEVPVGVNESGEPVTARKRHKSSVYGGIPGTGKSVSMQTSVLAQMCDPRVEGHVYDFKGGIEWKPVAPILHFYRSGADESDHQAILADMEDVETRMENRYKALHSLPDELESPDINDRLASMQQYDFCPIVIVMDESQEPFEDAPKEYRNQYLRIARRIIKKGRAVSITIESGTQEVNQKSLPFSRQVMWRFCHAVFGHDAVDQVLGTGAHGAGFLADKLTDEDVGIGYFGAGKNISITKSYFIDPRNGDLTDVIERCRADRENRSLLTGMAAGEIEPDDNYETILDRVKRIWPTGIEKLQWVELIDILHATMPNEYPAVKDLSNGIPAEVKRAVDVLSGQLGRNGIEAKSVRARYQPLEGKTISVRRGIYHTDVINADTPNTVMIQPGDTGFDTELDVDIQDDIQDDMTSDITDDIDRDTEADIQDDTDGDTELDGPTQ